RSRWATSPKGSSVPSVSTIRSERPDTSRSWGMAMNAEAASLPTSPRLPTHGSSSATVNTPANTLSQDRRRRVSLVARSGPLSLPRCGFLCTGSVTSPPQAVRHPLRISDECGHFAPRFSGDPPRGLYRIGRVGEKLLQFGAKWKTRIATYRTFVFSAAIRTQRDVRNMAPHPSDAFGQPYPPLDLANMTAEFSGLPHRKPENHRRSTRSRWATMSALRGFISGNFANAGCPTPR